ncbi:MAG: vitamin B12-dependent ribonucleotide reductase [Actinobacteria bacterium]|nr:vitamin B12-dependent ribonucleotide reductase [Actinomycetota bacterium]MBU4302051.1 vitamin B12-dependent ribonucleotide reductase [Actinomycetota bacterium]MBU4386237.1 vitamin B12-dependent ribonucleotide reductase [Actinomycetota bacterium]MBU4490280.1 vitamin B12-dependent ribonucleotide reductase [Actinomycetota bacterium]MCG2796534.1 vitamin B12-dependent ribonucleotide reductase [Actinomycetes bacterium]
MQLTGSTGLSDNAITVLEKRYLARDAEGRPVETPQQMFERVARAVAEADRPFRGEEGVSGSFEIFLEIITSLEFLPNSPTLMNAGRELGQLSACFVLPVEDSMEDIFEAVKNMALIHKSGGGTGFSFSRLRPKNDMVMSTRGVASGPVSFMTVFDAATETVKQGGTRRGANMGVLRVDHPDILEFIHAKEEYHLLNNFNISVALTRRFMEALSGGGSYDLVNPSTGEVAGRLDAREVFGEIAAIAWSTGEPGLIFLDRINQANTVPGLGEIESTNPCGEQPLLPFESCNLGSINLGLLVRGEGGEPAIDMERLEFLVREGVHFLDNVIDVSKFPLRRIEETTRANRKIGLGVMGFADMLIKLGIPYDSDEGLACAKEVMSFVSRASREASESLAAERGPFPNFDESTFVRDGSPPVRNATTTTIAPTGSISIIAQCASGVEPLFAVAYERRVLDGERLLDVHPEFPEAARRYGFSSDGLIERVASHGCLRGLEGVPEEVARIFVSAHEVTPEWHVRMQAAFQEFTDNAVSKTVNLSREATVEDIEGLYLLAYELGCKGVTVYRYGSRPVQVLYRGHAGATGGLRPRERQKVTSGITAKEKIGCGNLYITVNSDGQGICEVFTALGRAGGCPSQSEATSRLISLGLRSGIDISEIVEQLRGIRCLSSIKREGVNVLSCPDAIGRAIQKYLKANGVDIVEIQESECDMRCPECGAAMELEGGCTVCRSCGFSRCGPS